MSDTARDCERYEAVRAALQAKGYLKLPLERVFAGGRHARGPFQNALLVGALAGPPLGLLLAGLLVFDAQGSIPIWPDGILYTLLFAPVLGLVVALAEGLIATFIALRSRSGAEISPRRASLLSGLGVAAALAVYLGGWWAGSGGDLALRELAMLLLLALGAGLSGRIVSAAVLVQAALNAGRAPRLARPRIALWITAFAVTGALAAAAGVRVGLSERSEGMAVRLAPTAPARAVLVGWDGLGEDLLGGLLRRGHMPWTRRIWKSGRRARLLRSASRDPVAIWTTVATGCSVRRHGLDGAGLLGLRGARAPAPRGGLAAGPLELLTRLLPTRARVVRSTMRRVPAVWEITAEACKTAVIGWWATWPAARPGRRGGYVVSDGALVAARAGRGMEEAVFPPGWGQARASQWLFRARERALSLVDDAASLEASKEMHVATREALLVDLFHLAALEDALADPELRTVFVYLPGVDILRERGRTLGADPFALLETIEQHADAIDGRLAEILAASRTPQEELGLTALLFLPGRVGDAESGAFALSRSSCTKRAGEETMPLRAPEAEGAKRLSADSIAPTFLANAGFPVDSRMEGHVAPLLWLGEGSPGEPVLTNAHRARSPQERLALEGEVLERLRSLGYVE